MPITPLTLTRAAHDALDVQCACNLGGVSRSFADALAAVWTEAQRTHQGTTWVNQHPIVRLYTEQIAWLSGAGVLSDTGPVSYSDAYAWCTRVAGGQAVETPRLLAYAYDASAVAAEVG